MDSSNSERVSAVFLLREMLKLGLETRGKKEPRWENKMGEKVLTFKMFYIGNENFQVNETN